MTTRTGITMFDPACLLNRRIVIVLDVSQSMAERDIPLFRLAAAKDAVIEFATGALRMPATDLAVVGFADQASTIVYPTSSLSSLRDGLERLFAGGNTNYDAGLGTAWSHFSNVPRGRGEIVFLSDGDCNCGDDPLPLALLIKSVGISIDTIGVGGSPAAVDEQLLRAMASTAPNGSPRYRFIKDRGALLSHFGQLGTGLTR